MSKKPRAEEVSDLFPDAWARFERAVDVVAKSPPQHRVKAKRKSKKRVAKRRRDMLKRQAGTRVPRGTTQIFSMMLPVPNKEA